MQYPMLLRMAASAVVILFFSGDLRKALGATVAECQRTFVMCQGRCASLWNPYNPAPSQLCQVDCVTGQAMCIATASDQNAAKPAGGRNVAPPKPRKPRGVSGAATGPQPSILERDASPLGTSPAPIGRPAAPRGAAGPQLR
jgi:hypothetical protein